MLWRYYLFFFFLENGMKKNLYKDTLNKIFMSASREVVTQRFSGKSVNAVCKPGNCNGKCGGRRGDFEFNPKTHGFLNAN